MEEDVESTLTQLERRLRALQAELEEEPDAEADRFAAPPPPPPEPHPQHNVGDFGEVLHRTTAELTAAWEQHVASTAGPEAVLFRGEVALDARADLPALCSLDHALAGVGGVTTVTLRAYAGGHAALDVALDRPVALVGELRRALPHAIVEAVRPGRISLILG